MDLDMLYKSFIENGPDLFCAQAILSGIIARQGDCKSEEELLKASYDSLKMSRELGIEEKMAKEWREISRLLRIAAHRVFYQFDCESSHPGFLRLV